MPVLPPPPQEFTAIEALKDVHFDFDKYEIRPADVEILDANTAWMKANPEYLILVEGHADERGTNEYNLALGERRAKATLNYLLARGLAADRFTLVSYGKERPSCSERNEACWAQNRRAHFLVKGQ
ncbi:MAG: peptidoglycan-associated lipoprotein Pal [Candidatus Rokubacteria bacterium]|nr:peptidoglycan-associated lipoprotein Pal [Candidatus Rokubacteria bacterium]